MLEYTLRVHYRPDLWREAERDEGYRAIDQILLKVNGRNIIFPQAAFLDLHDALEPSAIYTDGSNEAYGRFRVRGGDGEKSYEVAFIFARDHLVKRELYRHATREPEVIRFEVETP